MRVFRLISAGILSFIHYIYMIKDDYFNSVWDKGPFMVIMETDFWWIGGLYFFSFLTMYYIILTTDNSDFGWKSISFYSIGHIIMTLIAISICRSNEVNGVIENGIAGIVLSFLSMILLRGVSVNSLLDGSINHVKGVLLKSNDKRYRASLERISASGPKGKKAVEDLMDKREAAKDGIKHADELAKRFDIYN